MILKQNDKKSLFYCIRTFGCQMNVNDSEYLAGQLEEMGYRNTSDLNVADIIILNTCCVREKVEQKIYSMAGRVNQIKKSKPEIIFGICGCLAQKDSEIIHSRIPSIDIIFGPSQITSLPYIISLYHSNKKNKPIIFCKNNEPFDLGNKPVKHLNQITAYVQIMKGCNNFCSYCIVPFTRGPEESRPIKEIIKEVNMLAENNFKEVTLLGQNVNSYGLGLHNEENFLSLLSQVNDNTKIGRIRFTTSHPKDFKLYLIKIIRDGDRICEHIHLPLQSGSDKILNQMNRKYSMEQYYNIVNNIRRNIPEASITTDIMVGFPGETDKDFEKTVEAFKKIQFDSAYTFIYSSRENVLSSLLGEEVPLLIKKERLWILIELQKKISEKKNKNIVGETVEVLVENSSKKGIDNQLWGKTRTNKVVVFPYSHNSKDLIGHFVNVKIKNTDAYTLYGELIDVKDK